MSHRAVLRNVDLSGSRMDQLGLLDVTLRGCNLANLQAPRASLVRVRVQGCRLTGIRFFEAFLRDLTFVGCRMDLASLGSCRLQQVTCAQAVPPVRQPGNQLALQIAGTSASLVNTGFMTLPGRRVCLWPSR